MRILLTGGTGFVGSHFIKVAIQNYKKIYAIKRNKSSKAKIDLIEEPQWIIKDFSQLNLSDLNDFDILIHLASHSTNVPYDSLENCLKFNVFDTLNLFNRAYDAGIRKFIVTGSSFEYGKKGEEFDFIPPDAPLFPTQTYPASKAAASIILTQWALSKDVSLKILRLFQVYGEGEFHTRLWPSLKEKALRGHDFKMTLGDQIRDFISVEDVAERIIIEAENMIQERISIKNIGSGKPKKLKDFVLEVWEQFEAKGKIELGAIAYRNNEVMRYVPNIHEEYIIR